MKPYFQDDYVTIYNGDCREIIPSLPVGMIGITDPPYGIGIKYSPSYDDNKKDYWSWFLPCLDLLKTHLVPLIFTHGSGKRSLEKISGYDWIGVWNKPGAFGARIGNSCVLPHWEPIFMFGIHKMGVASRYTSDVFTFNPQPAGDSRLSGNGVLGREKWYRETFENHPCPKPLALFGALITAFVQNDETLCDPFAGSGTTLVAAKERQQKAIGIEIEEKYCEIAARRLAQEVLPLSVACPRSEPRPSQSELLKLETNV